MNTVDHLPVPTRPDLREREVRLEALKTVAARLAHDCNNYLAPVLGWLSLIREEAVPESHAAQYAATGEASARAAEASLEQILSAVRPERRFHPADTDFMALVEAELNAWTAALPQSVLINVSRHLEPCSLCVDPEQWRRVLRNLLNNVRFGLALGGEVQVELKPQVLTAEQATQLGLAETQVLAFSIRDNGIGMSAETRVRAADPCFSTRPKNQALGLGLTAVYYITRLQGGQLDIESAEYQGTCVRIWLPVKPPFNAHDFEPTSHAARPGLGAAPKRNGKILLVDDDVMVREVLKAFLERANYRVLTAKDAEEGLKIYQKNAADLSLIISDIHMPGMDGIEFVRRLRLMAPDVRVMMLSGEGEITFQRAREVFRENPLPMMKKPCTLHELLSAVKEQIGSN